MLRFLVPLLLISSHAYGEMVTASYYTTKSCKLEGNSGVYTASGEMFNERAQTCAHPKFKFGTVLKVKNPKNGAWYYCRVNDRGPAKWTGHGIDLTPRGFELLGIPLRKGVARLEVLKKRRRS